MNVIAFLLACLAVSGHARRVVAKQPPAAFMPSGPGARGPISNPKATTAHPVMNEAMEVAETPTPVGFNPKEMAGVTAPFGFFDPMGFSTDVSEGRMRFYREVELKHGRLGMLAALGFVVGEQFHPLFGGKIDVPSYLAFQETPLQSFWPAVVLAISIAEVFSVFSFNSPFGGEPWSIRSDYALGNLGFDPMGLKPTDAKELKEMQTKELNNGRLAMLAAAGMIAQELVTGQKLF
mmetsp:Transcript_15426/g.27618  ORF Transcript_15426/g.27618 Transcript_15426/m.27618 type:complete len:235 (+) Transcript_15426:80-784(+)